MNLAIGETIYPHYSSIKIYIIITKWKYGRKNGRKKGKEEIAEESKGRKTRKEKAGEEVKEVT